jgi:hypothetical protein
MEAAYPTEYIRDLKAKRACLAQLADAHDRFSEIEQMAHVHGETVEAEGAHRYALWVLRAYRAELDDPEVAA